MIGEHRVRRAVRAHESVSRELLHQVEDFLGLLLRHVVPRAALHEGRLLAGHLLGLLLPHRPAEEVGLRQREPGQAVRDLHHLVLVDDHAVRLPQDRLQRGMHVRHPLLPVLALREVVDHAALDGPRTEERVDRDDVLERIRQDLPEEVPHPPRLQLEDPDRLRLLQERVGLGVVERERRQVDRLPGRFQDEAGRVVENGEGAKPEEVHLEEADPLERFHVELGRDVALGRAVHRDVVGELAIRTPAAWVEACRASPSRASEQRMSRA